MNSLKLFTDRLFAPILAKPERGLWLLMALQFIAWAVIPYLYQLPPPLDVVGHSIWMRDTLAAGGDIFSYPHPPLPQLINHLFNFGQGFLLLPHLVIAQLVICLTFYLIYRLGVAVFGNKKQALAGVFLLLLMQFFFRRYSTDLNHENAMLPFWMGLILIFYYATRPLTQKANQHFYWLLFGVVAGIATLTKLTIGILLLTMIIWMLWDKNTRAHLTTKSPYMGAAIALILMGLHFYLAFFDATGNLRLNYFTKLSFGNPNYDFLLTLYELQKYVALLVSVAGIIFVANFIIHQSPLHAPLARNEHSFVLFFAFAPLILTLLASLIFQQPIRHWWLSNMFSLFGVAFVALIYQRWHDGILKIIVTVCACFILYNPILSYAVGIKKAGSYSPEYVAALAQKIEDVWQENYTTPRPHVIVYDFDTTLWVIDLLAPSNLLVSAFWHDLDGVISHEVTQQHGALFIYQESANPRIKERLASARDQKAFDQLTEQAQIFTFENKHDKDKPHRVGFVLIPPKQ